MPKKKKGYTVEHVVDSNDRWHVWTSPTGPHNLPTEADLRAAAEKIVPHFNKREWVLSAETLTPGALHLKELGFAEYLVSQ